MKKLQGQQTLFDELYRKILILNEKRILIEKKIFEEAIEQAIKQKYKKIIIVKGKHWHKGVLGIIAPMINTKEECEKFVSYCRYPPLGQRSFGPMRAQLNYGADYFQKANNSIITLAMVEKQEAIKQSLNHLIHVPFKFENDGSQVIFNNEL